MAVRFLSYFTRPLNIKPAISAEPESVAKSGLSLDGFDDIAKFSVDEKRLIDNRRKNMYRIRRWFSSAKECTEKIF